MELYLICEDSLEGIFTGIYEAYLMKRPHEEIHIQVGEEENLRLFAEYRHIVPDPGKAVKVARTIGQKFGSDGYMSVCRALASPDSLKGEAIYKMIVKGLLMKNPAAIMDNLANPDVLKVFELARFCGRETHLLTGFIRFKEMDNGILYSPIGPKNNILTFLMPHFADRLPLENFVIHDENRGLFGLHPKQKKWYVVTEAEGFKFNPADQPCSENEAIYSELFTMFFHTIAIEGRKNPKLHRNIMPLRYREYMTEYERHSTQLKHDNF
ncbi:MAG: TIGR03915 family putative DNA repair protein [Lachnospiraceae bacterium]|nr:TIGR03915 family putative DNA repair protein [Lachnospiraceae bacterium]